jgi:hypothetical protein
MSFQPKARYLPEDVEHYKAPTHPMQYVWMTLAICLALIGWAEPVPDAAAVQVNAPVSIVELAEHQASLIASCMNGGALVYTDPHTGKEWAIFCDKHVLSRPM